MSKEGEIERRDLTKMNELINENLILEELFLNDK